MTTVTIENTMEEVPTTAEVPTGNPSLEEIIATSQVFVEEPCIPIKMFETHVEIELTKGVIKNITHEEFKALITRTETQTTQEEIKGLSLPSNVFFFAQNANRIYVSCYYAGGVRNLKYNDTNMDIIAPNIVISHVLRTDKKDLLVESSRFFCTDLPISKLPRKFLGEIDNAARVFLLPMSNTYDDARMCYGGNNMPVRFADNNIRGLDYYYSFLWDTPFNNDLGIRACGTSGVRSWYNLLKKAKDENLEFPYSCLRGWREGEYSKQSTLNLSRDD